MEKNELVVYDKNGQIIDCQFERMDFENPEAILNYASDVIGQISCVLDSTAQMAIAGNIETLDENQIASITSFDESLDESDRAREKEKKQLPIVKAAKSVLTKFGIVSSKQSDLTTYKGRYEEYCRGIDSVCDVVQGQIVSSLEAYQLKGAIKAEMKPFVEQLRYMCEVALNDKLAFDRQTEELEKGEQTPEIEMEIKYRKKISAFVNSKLEQLEKAKTAYQQQMHTFSLQQITDVEIALQGESYLKHCAPILKAQGSVMVFSREQKEKLESFKLLYDASNQALQENARQVLENTEATMDLKLNGGITMDTLHTLDDTLKNGVEVINSGNAKKQEMIEKEREMLDSIQSSLDEYGAQLDQLFDTSEFVKSIDSKGRKVKQIGRRNIKGKK